MLYNKKILIVEYDDFLREILGNILHKKGNYVSNSFSIKSAITENKGKKIDTLILGTSCPDYKGKNSIHYIQKNIPHVKLFIINNTNKAIDFIPKDMQMNTHELSIQKIIKKLS